MSPQPEAPPLFSAGVTHVQLPPLLLLQLSGQTLSIGLELPVYPSQEVLSLTWSLSFYLQPIQRLKGKPENAFGRKPADLLALRTSSVFGAPDIIRLAVNAAACFQLPPVPVIPRQSSSTPMPPVLGSTALRGSVLTLSTQPKIVERNEGTSVPGDLGTHFGMSARFSLIPQVLTTPGFPTKGALHSTSFLTSSTTKEPRGDM